jgi:P27 family predicted phage terminase small subunit
LSRDARDLWLSIERTYVLEDHHVAILTAALEAWDRARDARHVIESKGLTYEDRFGQPKPRPEVKIEKDARGQFRRLMRELGLDFAEVPEPRPPRIGG